jgi:hypothetical protein
MFKFWSETPAARLRELTADLATWAWVAFWTIVVARIHAALSAYSAAGRALRDGGTNLQAAGAGLGESLHGLPLVGAQVQGLATDAFRTAGEPFIFVGSELESLILFVARLLAILLLAVVLVPWLSRYVPWRARRLATLRAANNAIRRAPSGLSEAAIDRTLAARALYRLTYEELLEHTSDPIGDFASGDYGRLARAELASVGLRPRNASLLG